MVTNVTSMIEAMTMRASVAIRATPCISLGLVWGEGISVSKKRESEGCGNGEVNVAFEDSQGIGHVARISGPVE